MVNRQSLVAHQATPYFWFPKHEEAMSLATLPGRNASPLWFTVVSLTKF